MHRASRDGWRPLRSSFLALVHRQAPLVLRWHHALGRIERFTRVWRQCWFFKVLVSALQHLQPRYSPHLFIVVKRATAQLLRLLRRNTEFLLDLTPAFPCPPTASRTRRSALLQFCVANHEPLPNCEFLLHYDLFHSVLFDFGLGQRGNVFLLQQGNASRFLATNARHQVFTPKV